METRANFILIGLFTLAVILGGAGFVYWFHHLNGGGERATYRIVYQGVVSGLRTGSAVLFNGIRVGEVTRLDLDPQDSTRVIATVAVDANTPIRDDTRVGLSFQGLTGVAAVSMQGVSSTRPILHSTNAQPAVLQADPSLSQDIMESGREVIAKIDKFIADNETSLHASLKNIEAASGRIDKFIADNESSLSASFKNLETVSGTLARNSERFDRIMAGLDNLAGGPEGKGDIQEAARAMRQLAENLDKRAAEISSGISRFSSIGAREFEALSGEGRRTLAAIERAVRNFDRNPQRLLFGGSNSVPEYGGRR